MTEIFELYFAISIALTGIFAALIGFNIIKLKGKKPEDEKRMIIWRKKFGKFFKILGIVMLFIGVSLFILSSSKNHSKNWTPSHKEELKNQVISNSPFIQSFSPEIKDSVVTCFVEKYTEKYTLNEALEIVKWTDQQKLEVMIPIMRDCLEQFGVIEQN